MTTAANPQTPPSLRRYAPSGLCAIEPQAFGAEFPVFAAGDFAPFRLECDGKVAVVEVRGALSFEGLFFQTYGWILSSVIAALQSEAVAVVMRIRSPGGDVDGCFDTARAIRAAAKAKGKPLYAFTDSRACSSAYALASAATHGISITESASVGSVGVIATAVETTRADAAMGLRFAIVTSGARKADGNPHVELSDDARAQLQANVDQLAGIFFGLVTDHRGGLDPRPLEAASLIGQRAIDAGLADQIETWDALMARASECLTLPEQTAKASITESRMADKDDEKDKDEARKALAAAAASGNAKAKRALAAYDEGDDEKAEDEKESPKDDDDKAKKAKAKAEEDEKEKARALAAAASGVPAAALASFESALRDVRAENGALKAQLDASQREAFLATRPDLSPEMIRAFDGLPLDQIKKIAATIPKGPAFKSEVPELGRAPVAGAVAGSVAGVTPNPDLDMSMGLTPFVQTASFDAKSQIQTFGVEPKGAK